MSKKSMACPVGDDAPDSTAFAQPTSIYTVGLPRHPRRVSVTLKAQETQGVGWLRVTGSHGDPMSCLINDPTLSARIAIVTMDVEFIDRSSQRRGRLTHRVRA